MSVNFQEKRGNKKARDAKSLVYTISNIKEVLQEFFSFAR